MSDAAVFSNSSKRELIKAIFFDFFNSCLNELFFQLSCIALHCFPPKVDIVYLVYKYTSSTLFCQTSTAKVT